MPVSNWWSILWKTFLCVLFVISLFVRLILIPWFFQSISLFWFGFAKTKYIHGTLPPSLPGRHGDKYIGLWGTLLFHLPLVDLPKCGCLKAFTHLFWENKAFSTRRNEGSPSPTGQKFIHPSSIRKGPQVDSSPIFYFPRQRGVPLLNNNFRVITQWKLHF